MKVAVAELVSGIVIEVGEGRHTQRAVGIGIECTSTTECITDIRSPAQMMTETGVVGAIYADGCGQTCIVERLLRIIVRMETVAPFDQVQYAYFRQGEIRYVRYLSVRIDRVPKIGGVHVLVAQADAQRSSTDSRGIMRSDSR